MSDGIIRLRGARQNNLQGIDLDLPLGKLIVLTGPSGSGKSSLAFDTIYAEGQRRYVETFSPYTRQFLERMDKPQADQIDGIPPAIAIEQSNHVKNTRSTVGTITEINDYLKLLFPRVAKAFCPDCGRPVQPETSKSIVRDILRAQDGRSILVAFEVPTVKPTDVVAFFDFLKAQGYLRVWIQNKIYRTDESPGIKRLPPVVRVIQDRITVNASQQNRITEAVETALRFGKGKIVVIDTETFEEAPYSTSWHCAYCDKDIRPPTPGLFSFNNPLGACPECRGFGRVIGLDLDRALPNKRLSIAEGVVKAFHGSVSQESQRDLLRGCARQEIDIHCPFEDLPKADQQFVINGERKPGEDEANENRWYGIKGFFHYLESRTYKMHVRVFLSRYRNYTPCPKCHGGRYQPETLNFRVLTGDISRTLPDLMAIPAAELANIIASVPLPKGDSSAPLLQTQIVSRLQYLDQVGLGYLSLNRSTRSLSGGEIERVNLTTCLGASLVNTLFVMDEPTVGLHPRDVKRLLSIMEGLRDKGNTLLVVEHEEAIMRAADHIVDIGPGRGTDGGKLVYSGPVEKLSSAKNSLTAKYLDGELRIDVPTARRTPELFLEIEGVTHRNIQKQDFRIPLGVFCCITGVSGSGKSTLVNDVLYRNLSRENAAEDPEIKGHCDSIHGLEHVEDILLVNQSPLSRTPRSTPAVYLGVFDVVREIFGMSAESLAEGMSPSTFSFNSSNGRCERCAGLGYEKIEMQFLSDLYLKCPECEGKRYQPRVLKIQIDGKNIHDILEMTVTEALTFFADKEKKQEITGPLRILKDVGLEYLKLGQPVHVLSGGESQRLKLARHLAEHRKAKSLLILDEPTTGLHVDDIAQLIKVFQKLVESGNSLLVIEHNLEVIKCADWLLDLGPDAGANGGKVVAEGTPEDVAKVTSSHTGQYLAPMLGNAKGLQVKEIPPRKKPAALHPAHNSIRIRGAREHNLKNISLDIPRDKMVVITGLSGSGKSTLAFDILFAEGQRRFLDSMSPYARQFVDQLEKPDVDSIEGLPPSVAIEQRVTRGGGKSTVATITEVHHFLRLLFSKVGTQFCPDCHVAVEKTTLSAIVSRTEDLLQTGTVRIYAPLIKGRKGFHTDVARWAERQGYEELLVDGKSVKISQFKRLERYKEHTIDVLIGEIDKENKKAATAIVKQALEVGKGTAKLVDAKKKETILSTEMACPDCGRAFEELEPRLFSFHSPHGWCPQCRGFGEIWEDYRSRDEDTPLDKELAEEKSHESLEEGEARICPECNGNRLNSVALNVKIQDNSISDVLRCSVSDSEKQLKGLSFTKNQKIIARDILDEIIQRLHFMQTVGLEYLSLDRSAKTLSGGESQRIRLSAQLGSNLRGVLYVLDEPTIGLHARDNARLLDALKKLTDGGNSLLIVEHDEETMKRADFLIDLGPKAGIHGGEVITQGTYQQVLKNPNSLTSKFLKNPPKHPLRGSRRSLKDCPGWVKLSGANKHNLRDVDVEIPINRLTVVSGISGSGKSTLIRGVLLPAVQNSLARTRKRAEQDNSYQTITGCEFLETVIEVDQSPIGKTSRSTPATYIKVFDEIRKYFAQIPEARVRGYTASRFSFNNEGGRCETCQGQGVIKLEMNFLPSSYMPCEDCEGKRYNSQTLEVLYNGKSIGDVMEMTIEQAAEFFSANPKIRDPLKLLVETGLGYLKLGQPSPTLSGGEAQRLKLVTQLARGAGRERTAKYRQNRNTKSILYLLEEPTIGLHMADVELLLKVLHRLVDEGGTVVVIEHHIGLIAEGDYVIDIGPEAGSRGGKIVTSGTPEKIITSKASHTAPFLKEVLMPASKHALKLPAAH
ncbi:MAG: excinuclease ABC subunit UvrA [Chthoniobacterales bacterium]